MNKNVLLCSSLFEANSIEKEKQLIHECLKVFHVRTSKHSRAGKRMRASAASFLLLELRHSPFNMWDKIVPLTENYS
jgi:hypothetical protein